MPNSSNHLDLFNSYVGRYDGEIGHRKSAKAVSCTPTLMVTISFHQTECDIFLRNACSYAITWNFVISIYEKILQLLHEIVVPLYLNPLTPVNHPRYSY